MLLLQTTILLTNNPLHSPFWGYLFFFFFFFKLSELTVLILYCIYLHCYIAVYFQGHVSICPWSVTVVTDIYLCCIPVKCMGYWAHLWMHLQGENNNNKLTTWFWDAGLIQKWRRKKKKKNAHHNLVKCWFSQVPDGLKQSLRWVSL